MPDIKKILFAAILLVAGCSSKVYGVVGDSGDVFTGQMTGGTQGRIELDDGKGTRCVGEYTGRKSTAVTVTKIVVWGLTGDLPSFSSGAGRALLTCSDGQQALVQLTPTGGESGYGFGTTRDGQPVRVTYGLSRGESAPYLKIPPAQTASAPGGSTGHRVSTGTGFYITRQGHILTAAHVVRKCRELAISRTGGAPADARVVAEDDQNDLAVLLAPPAPAIAAFRTGQPIRPGDPVVAYGFPFTGALSSGGSLTSGSVNALAGLHDDTRFLQISAPVQPGNSGGPLLDNGGNVVGIVTSQLNAMKVARATGAVPQNVNFAVKADFARTFLDANGIGVESATPGRELGAADIGERARRFSVLIECRD